MWKEAYSSSCTKPQFKILENSITVMLPITREDLGLSEDETIVYQVLSNNVNKSISEILGDERIAFGKSKVTALLKSMEEKNPVIIESNGRGTKYRKE